MSFKALFEVNLLHEHFEIQADRQGDAAALVCGNVILTYEELEERANRLAHYIRNQCIQTGDLIGIALDRSELPIIAILACLKAGAAYIPIDPGHPDERIRHIVDEAEISLILSEELIAQRLQTLFSGKVVALDTIGHELNEYSSRRLSPSEIELYQDNLCYVLYTSGSTGRPKGVMTEHRNAARFVTAFNRVCTTTENDRIYQGFSLGFDGSVEEIWMAFSNGATLVVGTKDAPRFGNDLASYLEENQISYFSTVPTMMSTITEDMSSLRQLVVSGEVCPPDLVERWAVPERLMLNVYGPTEATVNTTAFVCEPGRPITIGKTLDGYEAHVLDSQKRPVPNGTVGELYISGIGIARGYLRRPDLTSKQFLTLTDDGKRFYRTGDLARINKLGEIEFLGRADNQVKIRGYRVELSEIDALLLEQDDIAVAVTKLHDCEGIASLASYIELKEASKPLDRRSLLEELRSRLPSYMVPSFLEQLEEMPRLASGKVDRKKLPEPCTPLVEIDNNSATLEGHRDGVLSATFSPNGKLIVTASRDKTARLWDVADGKEIAVLEGHKRNVKCAQFSPDGSKVVTASSDRTARLWDTRSGNEIAVLRGHRLTVTDVQFSPDGTTIATASRDKTVRLWDTEDGSEIATLRGHQSYILTVKYSPDGKTLVTASNDNTAKLWDIYKGVEIPLPETPIEEKVAKVWAKAFKIDLVGVNQDFFLDLGGHSLLAAQMVAILREDTGIEIPVRNVYKFPTVRELAEHIERKEQEKNRSTESVKRPGPDPILSKPSLSTCLFQAGTIIGFYILMSWPVAVVITYADDILWGRMSLAMGIVFLFSFVIAVWPVIMTISIVAKWLIIGRYKPGSYPLWGSYYIRWWLVSKLQQLSGMGAFTGTPLMPVFYRMMGAKIGHNCAIETSQCSIWDCVSIGDNTSIGADTQILGYRVEDGYLHIGEIEIGSHCFVGIHSVLGLNVKMEDGARLDDQSMLPDREVIPVHEHRRGSPARTMDVQVPEGKPIQFSTHRKVVFSISAILCSIFSSLFLFAPTVAILFILITSFQQGWLLQAILGLTLALPLLVPFACVWITILKAILLYRAKPGIYDLYSVYYLRHWLAYGLMRVTRSTMLPIFTTIYLPPWMRLLGAKIGKHCEMSTLWSFMPELVTAGDGSFFADGCMLGGRRIFGGRFEIRHNAVGRHSFVGNSAILPVGASLGDNCLLGVLSSPPNRTEPAPSGTDWLGSPAFELPNRQKVQGFDQEVTYQPTARLYAIRAIIDAIRILIPFYTALFMGLGGIAALLYIYNVYGILLMIVAAPVLALLLSVLAVLIVVVLKWSVMGRFKPVIKPLWCSYVWLNEMVNGAYESIMAPVVGMLYGTPFVAFTLRLLGCKIGRHCYIATNLFSEFDLVEIGDHAALNDGAVIQNHLFEDRIMKSSFLKIGYRCSVGNMAVVLYDSRMEDGAVLGPQSLLMKGEIMPENSRWHGIPTEQAS